MVGSWVAPWRKNHWHKSTLWEEATRIPFTVVAPGIIQPGSKCKRPVDTLCIFPTLVELCKLKPVLDLDGVSIVPLLKEPNKEWGIPAVSEFRRGQCSVRSERYRYIQYSDGTSELYDHYNDPNEWNNLFLKNKRDHPEFQRMHQKQKRSNKNWQINTKFLFSILRAVFALFEISNISSLERLVRAVFHQKDNITKVKNSMI